MRRAARKGKQPTPRGHKERQLQDAQPALSFGLEASPVCGGSTHTRQRPETLTRNPFLGVRDRANTLRWAADTQSTELDLKPHPALTAWQLQRLLQRCGELGRLDVDCWRLPAGGLKALVHASSLQDLALSHVDNPCWVMDEGDVLYNHGDQFFANATPAAAGLKRLQISCFSPHVRGWGITSLAVSECHAAAIVPRLGFSRHRLASRAEWLRNLIQERDGDAHRRRPGVI